MKCSDHSFGQQFVVLVGVSLFFAAWWKVMASHLTGFGLLPRLCEHFVSLACSDDLKKKFEFRIFGGGGYRLYNGRFDLIFFPLSDTNEGVKMFLR